MPSCSRTPSLLVVDPLSNDRGHSVADDLFLARCLGPLTERLVVVTTERSAQQVREECAVETKVIPPLQDRDRWSRLRLLWRLLTLPRGYREVVFQSFEEFSTLFFMWARPQTRVHLIVTSNLRPDRLWRRPVLGRWLLRAVFRRAASIVVHCQREVERISELVPGMSLDKVRIKPFHQLGVERTRLHPDQKQPIVLFLGPSCPHKPVEPVLDLIRADVERKFRYRLIAVGGLKPETRAWLESLSHVEITAGPLEDDAYYRWFREAALVVLTHDRGFEGALSGAFCDAVASGTPVVARRMAPHDEFFARFGALGLLVDYDQPGWVDQFLTSDLRRLGSGWQANLACLRAACSLEANREVFRQMLGWELAGSEKRVAA